MEKKPNFIGTYFYSMDAKNRLAIPAKMRQQFSRKGELILTRGLEGCLNLYPRDVWLSLSEKLESVSMKNKTEKRGLQRILYGSACEVEFDEGGRILIPHPLIDAARLKRDAAIVGIVRFVEIWAKPLWISYEKKHQALFRRHASQFEI